MRTLNYSIGRILVLIVLVLLIPRLGYSQADCVSSGDRTLAPITDGWIGHVYQLPVDATPNVETFMTTGQYKGVLKSEYLHPDSINFETDFGNYGDPTNDGTYASLTDDCQTRLSYFGVVFKGHYTLPDIGTYKITVNSDDGARLYINGTQVHDRWIRQDYVPGNARSYYVTEEAGFELNLELRYYELTIYNKVGFTIERYYGPGIIAGDQRISDINPNPVPFTSLAPAEFPDRMMPITYKWYYNNTNNSDTSTWTPIQHSNSVVYDVPAYSGSADPFLGVRYYHRRATSGNITYISDPVMVDLCKVNQIEDHTAYGDAEWIGYVYKGDRNFELENFQGRVREEAEFVQTFNGERVYFPTIEEDGGCSFFTDHFTVRYKMKIWVTPGIYDFEIWGDDGFRLTIQDEAKNYLGTDNNGNNYAIDNWTTGGATDERKRGIKNDIDIKEAQYFYFTLDYFESTFGSYLSFKATGHEFSVLPLEWGRVSAEACGPANCLTWETIQEKNTSHFELERSYNGMDWEMFDNSVLAQGNSTEKISYDFTDNQIMASKVYYRIRQVDLDGAYEYSEVMRVDNPFYATGFLPFPNPTMDKIRFFSKSEVVGLWLVSNDYLVNKEVKPEMMNDKRYEVDLVGLKPGNYVIVVETRDGEKDVFKVIKK